MGERSCSVASSRRQKRVSLDGKMLEEVNEDEEDEVQDDKVGAGNNVGSNETTTEVVQEVKFSSRVQFRAPDIIEL